MCREFLHERRSFIERFDNVLSKVIRGRLGGHCLDYFISDSNPCNKAEIRKFMDCQIGYDFWIPCSVHFVLLAMRESVTSYFNRDFQNQSNKSPDFIELNELTEEDVIEEVIESSESSDFARLTITARAIRALLNRWHTLMKLFRTTQSSLNINTYIFADIKTRFESTVAIFESITRTKSIL